MHGWLFQRWWQMSSMNVAAGYDWLYFVVQSRQMIWTRFKMYSECIFMFITSISNGFDNKNYKYLQKKWKKWVFCLTLKFNNYNVAMREKETSLNYLISTFIQFWSPLTLALQADAIYSIHFFWSNHEGTLFDKGQKITDVARQVQSRFVWIREKRQLQRTFLFMLGDFFLNILPKIFQRTIVTLPAKAKKKDINLRRL